MDSTRGNAERLTETQGGCALWAEREWVQSLLPAKESRPAGRKTPFELEPARAE